MELSECPGVPKDCNTSASFTVLDIGKAPSYVAICSSLLACLGSLLIFLTYWALRDMKKEAQTIITHLALADLISAMGYVVGSANFVWNYKRSIAGCTAFHELCKVQATVTSYSSMVSFSWTVILAIHFYLVMVHRRQRHGVSRMPFYVLFSWGAPLLIVLPLLATGHLGYSKYAASNWCFVKDSGTFIRGTFPTWILIVLLNGKLWEISCYIIVVILYPVIVAALFRQKRRILQLPGHDRFELRLIAIPVLFIFLRIWGTIQFFLSISKPDPCVSSEALIAFKILGFFQAIGDPGQGWGNAILYVFLSPVVRDKVLVTPIQSCMAWFGMKLIQWSRVDPVVNQDGDQESSSIAPLNPRARATNYRAAASSVASLASADDISAAPGPSAHAFAEQSSEPDPTSSTNPV